MALPDFPASLRPMLQRGKSRTVGERIVQGEPPAFEQWTSEQPAQWSFSLSYARSDAATFWAFVVANRGRWFNMPIRVEQGYIVHAVRFLPGFPQLASEAAEVLTYNCKAEARRIVRPIDPAEIADYAGIDANDLDIAINIMWPEPINLEFIYIGIDGNDFDTAINKNWPEPL